VYGQSPPERWNEYRGHVATGLNSADIVVAPTAAFLEQLSACYVFAPPTRVIRNGRAPVPYSCNVPREPIVLACGRPWDVSKNIRVLDDAAANARWSAYVIGAVTGPDGQAFKPRAIRAVGAQPAQQVHKWMHRASVFVHPALYEPFGLAVVEAANAGCALLLADIPTLRELWNGAAEFFNPRDSRHLRTKLDKLLADPARRQELATAAQARANNYRIESAASDYLETYRAVLRKHAHGERSAA
jgi:glycosyltransferase involved in cell wall biosynthesis